MPIVEFKTTAYHARCDHSDDDAAYPDCEKVLDEVLWLQDVVKDAKAHGWLIDGDVILCRYCQQMQGLDRDPQSETVGLG